MLFAYTLNDKIIEVPVSEEMLFRHLHVPRGLVTAVDSNQNQVQLSAAPQDQGIIPAQLNHSRTNDDEDGRCHSTVSPGLCPLNLFISALSLLVCLFLLDYALLTCLYLHCLYYSVCSTWVIFAQKSRKLGSLNRLRLRF